jgi:hypothetical protein
MTVSINLIGNTPAVDNLSMVVSNGLTAKVGGGQSATTPVTAAINRYTTVTTAADSATLPLTANYIGQSITIVNAAAANSMTVYPNTGEIINALSANTGFAVAANKITEFFCTNAGQWHSITTA